MSYYKLYFLLLLPLLVNAQFITGNVSDATTNEPLANATVYFSNTSIGTVTDLNGNFKIPFYENSQSLFTISLLGYETQSFKNPLTTDFSNIKLPVKIGELPAIYLKADDWSREKKERYFLQQFLGTTTVAKKCSIRNLDDIKMRFNPATHKMIAYSKKPILIENRDLNYLVTYELIDFEIAFEPVNLQNIEIPEGVKLNTHRLVSSFFAGNAFFSELDERAANKGWVKRHRKRAFQVSETRLFQLIIADRLEKEGYHLVFDRKKVPVEQHITSYKKDDYYVVNFKETRYEILDASGYQSVFQLDQPQLYVTEDGNVLNFRDLKFGGFISKLKVSGMLPLDFSID